MKLLILTALTALTGLCGATTYDFFSCPLWSTLSSLSSIGNQDCSNSDKRDLNHGFSHTYIKIGLTCYDWGYWNYARRIQCSDPEISCCINKSTRKSNGDTSCAERIGEFEAAWEKRVKRYDIAYWNCQRYSNKMEEFLLDCPSNADSILG